MSKEKELRRCKDLSGCWVLLGDGAMWCVPSLPMGDGCNSILDKLEAVFELQNEMVSLQSGVKEQLQFTKKLIKAGADFCFELLKHNYPQLTREYFDKENLVTIQHNTLFQQIVQGDKEIGEIIGERPGEGRLAAI